MTVLLGIKNKQFKMSFLSFLDYSLKILVSKFWLNYKIEPPLLKKLFLANIVNQKAEEPVSNCL